MSYYSKTVDYDISSPEPQTETPAPVLPPTDTGMSENERGHTNYVIAEHLQNQR